MKKLILIFIMLFSVTAYSQQKITPFTVAENIGGYCGSTNYSYTASQQCMNYQRKQAKEIIILFQKYGKQVPWNKILTQCWIKSHDPNWVNFEKVSKCMKTKIDNILLM